MNRYIHAAAGATLFAAVVALPGARAQEMIEPAEGAPPPPPYQAAPHPGPTAPPPVPPIPAAQPTSGQLVPPPTRNCFPYDADHASRQESLHFIFGSSYDFFGRRWQRPWPRPASQPAGTGYWTDYR